jgi:hypothetical protein
MDRAFRARPTAARITFGNGYFVDWKYSKTNEEKSRAIMFDMCRAARHRAIAVIVIADS